PTIDGRGRGLIETGLELRGTYVTERRVTTLAIVKHFDVLEQRLMRGRTSRVVFMIDQLRFQSAEEAFHDGVVVTVSSATHAALQAMSLQQVLVVIAGILHSPIAMMQQPRRRLTMQQRHPQGLAGEISSQMIGRGPADDLPRTEIDDRRQIQ